MAPWILCYYWQTILIMLHWFYVANTAFKCEVLDSIPWLGNLLRSVTVVTSQPSSIKICYLIESLHLVHKTTTFFIKYACIWPVSLMLSDDAVGDCARFPRSHLFIRALNTPRLFITIGKDKRKSLQFLFLFSTKSSLRLLFLTPYLCLNFYINS